MVETYYDPIEDLDLIIGENTSWKSKLNYIRKGLVSFPDNREGIHLEN